MRLCSIDIPNSRVIIKALSSDSAVYWETLEQAICEDENITEQEIKESASSCLEMMSKYKNPLSQGKVVESNLIEIVHTALRITPRVASNPGFWRWISLKYFFEVVQRRHAKPGEIANERNFGLKGTLESLLGRVWFRGEIAFESHKANPYELAMLGDQDFWRSHVLRKRYSNSRQFTKALIAFQYPGGKKPYLNPSSEGGIRVLTKRIQATHASNVLEVIDNEKLHIMLERLSAGLDIVGGEKAIAST